jgi:hypothetical protein
MFVSVPWKNQNDTLERPYFSLDSYETVKNYVFMRYDMASKVARQTIPVSATLENIKYHATHSHLRHHYQSKKVLKWVSPSGYSIVLSHTVAECDIADVLTTIPPTATSRDYKTPKELVKGLQVCNELDDIHVMKRGMGEERIRLNSSEYAQPRRISWSVELGDTYVNEATGLRVRDLFCYGQSYRKKDDWKARSMPKEIFTLGLHLWYAAFSNLSAISRVCPPTSCQLLIYHSYFAGKMGFHRDVKIPGVDMNNPKGYCQDNNSQIRGSSVLIYTVGDPMLFSFKKSTAESKGTKAAKKESDAEKNKIISVSLNDGDLLVLDPRDDETYTHATRFESKNNPNKELHVRMAFVYRWVSNVQPFWVDGPNKFGLFCSKEEGDKDKNREQDTEEDSEEDSEEDPDRKPKHKTKSTKQLKRNRQERSLKGDHGAKKSKHPEDDKKKGTGRAKKLPKGNKVKNIVCTTAKEESKSITEEQPVPEVLFHFKCSTASHTNIVASEIRMESAPTMPDLGEDMLDHMGNLSDSFSWSSLNLDCDDDDNEDHGPVEV